MLHKRKISLFEKILLLVCILVIITGYFFVYGMVAKKGLSWDALQTTFLWLILIVTLILAIINENTKEELKIINSNQAKEIKLLREDLARKR
ncbi:hypothetical protein CEE44_04905 [Candidatus Woesearchaeota archaeon B3_Woes]|nr:MAG: hypothetical protein CEE44_04905 [Candidatus Woesearchaeota archaeon B3_Woes]